MIPILYHYCSYNTLLTILQNRTFRLTSIELMNDYSEIFYGSKLLVDIALKNGFITDSPQTYQRNIEGNARSVNKFYTNTQLEKYAGPYIMCFSEKGDGNIPMWKMYGDDFKGVSIGFDLNKIPNIKEHINDRVNNSLCNALKLDVPHNNVSYKYRIGLSAIIYTKEELEQLYLLYYNGWSNLHKNNIQLRIKATIMSMAKIMPFVKSEYFYYEKEHRLAYMDPVRFEEETDKNITDVYYIKNNKIVKGYDLAWELENTEHPIVDITLGPAFVGDTEDLVLYLDKLGYKEIQIKQSAIPIR